MFRNEVIPSIPIFEKEAILGKPLLGQGLLCGYSRVRCGQDTQVCPLSGKEGARIRTVTVV
jgi:hypothetical protein